jgi:hypothetical protein
MYIYIYIHIYIHTFIRTGAGLWACRMRINTVCIRIYMYALYMYGIYACILMYIDGCLYFISSCIQGSNSDSFYLFHFMYVCI